MTIATSLKKAAAVLAASAITFTAFSASLSDSADMVTSADTRFGVVQADGELWSGGQSWSVISAQEAPTGKFATVAAGVTPADLVRGYTWQAMSGTLGGIDFPVHNEVELPVGTFAHAVFQASKGDATPSAVAPNATFAIAQPDGTLWSNGALWMATSSRATPVPTTAQAGSPSMVGHVTQQIFGNQTENGSPWQEPGFPRIPNPK